MITVPQQQVAQKLATARKKAPHVPRLILQLVFYINLLRASENNFHFFLDHF